MKIFLVRFKKGDYPLYGVGVNPYITSVFSKGGGSKKPGGENFLSGEIFLNAF